MKTERRIFMLFAVLLLSISVMLAQNTTRDVVYLKNGSVIKGSIIEMIPDKSIKIQTSDGSIFVYTISEVEKIAKETIQSNEQTNIFSGSNQSLPSQFSIFGGAAIPSGDFAKEEGGAAKTGFTAGLQFVTGGAVGWIINGSYSQNKTEIPSSISSMGMSGEAGNWSSILVLTGVKIGTANSTGANFFIAPLVGALFGKSPDVTLRTTSYNTTITATQKSASSTAVAYGVAMEVIIGGTVSIGGRYIASKPKYEITATRQGYSYTSSGTLEQNTALIQAYVGIIF